MQKIRAYLPHFVVFISSMGIMIIELVASRIVAKYFGNSLYTWTGVIGVVLGGISLGNYIGGKIADRFDPRKSIGILLLIAAGLTFLILGLDRILESFLHGAGSAGISPDNIFQIVLWIVILFFLPSTALGTIAPVMAKFALEESVQIGNTVGSIYAVSAIGSIVGTFLAGFVFIPLLGVTRIIFIVGGVVAALSLLTGSYRLISGTVTAAVIVAYLLTPGAGVAIDYPIREDDKRIIYATDSQYSHIEVRDVDEGDYVERQLVMDGLVHNRYDPERPDTLLYNYERIFAGMTDWYLESRDTGPLSVITLGGGAMLMPDWLTDRYRLERNEVVEIDPEVVQIAYEYFDVPRSEELQVFTSDARGYMNAVRGEKRYDIVYLDVFNSFAIPSHLTTREFLATVEESLEPGGVLMTNAIDVYPIGRFLNAFVNTTQAVFDNVNVYIDFGASLDKRLTYVVVASNENLPGEIVRHAEMPVGERVPEPRLEKLEERHGNFILTDEHAPVDNFMAPVFLRQVQ